MGALRLAVIGTGSVVREIYQHLYFRSRYSRGLQIVAACDERDEALDWFGEVSGLKEDDLYRDYRKMLERTDIDLVAVNTPDQFHREPVCAAMEAGFDVMVPKPAASTVADAHEMLEVSRRTGRSFGVDFHKRGDPVVREATARYRRNEYGTLQIAQFSMLDKLLVADPNHCPRFFSSPDFAEHNSPVSFLTSHMADTFLTITGHLPDRVRATGFRQKLASLAPTAVRGYDTVDTEIVCRNGSIVHICTGWILPNSAPCLTVQSGRMLCTDGAVDLWKEWYGFHELTPHGINDRNVLFMNFGADEVSGYGVSHPGGLLETLGEIRARSTQSAALAATLRAPVESGLLTTLVCEAAHTSLESGVDDGCGVIHGEPVNAFNLLADRVGRDAAHIYYGSDT